MNTGYVLWFAALVVVAGAALIWLAIGDVPEIPPDPEAASEPGETLESAEASEPPGEDGIARPA